MQYKKLLLDIDGTVLAKGELLSDNLKSAITRAKNHISISFCTGRDPEFTLQLAHTLHLTSNHVVDDGSRVIDPTGKELWVVVLPQDVIKHYLDLAHRYGFKIAATVAGKLKLDLTKTDRHISRLLAYYLTKAQVDTLTSYVFSAEYEVKVVWFDERKGYNVSVTHMNGNKQHGIQFLLNHEGVKSEEVIGVGDGINDLPIFTCVGLKVAMGNASDEVKAGANLVVSSAKEDGVVEILKKYVFSKA